MKQVKVKFRAKLDESSTDGTTVRVIEDETGMYFYVPASSISTLVETFGPGDVVRNKIDPSVVYAIGENERSILIGSGNVEDDEDYVYTSEHWEKIEL